MNRLAELLGPRAGELAAELDPARRRRRRLGYLAAFAPALAAVTLLLLREAREQDAARAAALAPAGVDLVICLDVSRSMLARDVAPSRLGRAQAEIRALAARARADRLALVAFAGSARLLVPLTHDGELLADLADACGPASVPSGGSDLGAALEAALAALAGAEAGAAAVLLLSDGEDLEGRGARAAAALGARGIPVHGLGLGSLRGSKIAVPGARGEEFLRDPGGTEVLTALDAAALRAIAESSGGTAAAADPEPGALARIYEERILPASRARFAREAHGAGAGAAEFLLWCSAVLWILALGASDARKR